MAGTHRTSAKTGARFGILTVGQPLRKNEHSQVLWEVACDCGRKTYAWGYNLVKGKKKDCGCVRAGLSEGEVRIRQAVRPSPERDAQK